MSVPVPGPGARIKILELIADADDGVCQSGYGTIIPSPNTKKAVLGVTGELVYFHVSALNYGGYNLDKVDLSELTKLSDEFYCELKKEVPPKTVGRYALYTI